MKKKFTIFVFIFTLLFSVTNLDVLASSKASTIEQLQKKITELTKQVKNLTSNLATKTKEANNLEKENTTLRNQIKSKDDAIMSKENDLGIIKEGIEEKNKIIEKQIERIKQLEQLSKAEVVYTDKYLNAGNDVKWYKFKTKYTNIFLTPKAYQDFSYIVDISDELLGDVGSYFGVSEVSAEISTFIWNGNEVIKEDRLVYEDKLQRISIDVAMMHPVINHTPEDFVSIFVHEYAHVFLIRALRTYDYGIGIKWLNEGIPEYINNQFIDYSKYDIPKDHLKINKYTREDFSRLIFKILERDKIPMLTKLPTQQLDYLIYESFVYFLENTYGHKKFLEFNLEAHKNPNLNEVYKNFFGIDENQLIKNWKDYFSLN
ncbi:hypothetical protein ACFSO7_20615 [Bacillus sp. CGMCC 1.16607]|uniref:hypothetical protein n=1 Tax=Bacillus sp. CGMCC 1.16607 TaxID=3351842 RepID=UPI003645A653